MSLYDFWWNTVQAGQIDDVNEEVKELKKRVEVLEDWIRYLTEERKVDLPDGRD